ncbi:MAG TPA: HEAT repeat domain-containing protein [Fimbriimonadaceae bacterium]|nr:HEAT repeat domain-containing protein [Fimbriimonadaceae bacterium]
MPVLLAALAILQAQEARIQELVQQLEGPSYYYDFPTHTPADAACEELEKVGAPAVPYLIVALTSHKKWARIHSIEILAKIGDRRAVDPVLGVLRHDQLDDVKGVAAFNLGAFGDKRVVDDLLVAADSGDKDLNRGAWYSLGELREPRAIPVLIKNLGARIMNVQLGGDDQDEVPLGALQQIGAAAVPGLIEAIREGPVQTQAAIVLGRVATPAAMDALRAAYNDSKTRFIALAGYGECTKPEAVDAELAALLEPDNRQNAVGYFERHPNPACVAPLRKAVAAASKDADKNSFFLICARQLLEKLAGPDPS